MTILDEIIEVKKEEVKKLRANFTLAQFRDSKFFEIKKMDFAQAINIKNEIGIIAEVKKASPSKGIIRDNFNHIEIASIYIDHGANAISVLTDRNFFKGDVEHLREIAEFKSVPLLRKDFIIDEYQIFQSKSIGADAVLLIAEALSENQIIELTNASHENDLDVLLEIHNEDQLDKIDFTKNRIIGINNRDLKTFSVDLGITEKLSKVIPPGIIKVSESGFNNNIAINKIREAGCNAVLIGEHFMKHPDIAESLKQMKEWCLNEN